MFVAMGVIGLLGAVAWFALYRDPDLSRIRTPEIYFGSLHPTPQDRAQSPRPGEVTYAFVVPVADATFDAVTCCVSIDYLVQPVAVLREAARVLRPAGVLVCTYSNRCFPTKAIRGWLATDDDGHGDIVRTYLEQAGGYGPVTVQRRTPPSRWHDPLYGVWAVRDPHASARSAGGPA